LLAGDWTRTGIPFSMESAVRSGWLAAEQVLGDVGRPRKLALKIKETEGLSGVMRRLNRQFKL
jgi:15-cis-phytoene desaturase